MLTANIASLFDLYGVEKGLEHFRSSSRLNFLHFRYYLLQEVFITLSNTTTLADIRNFESKIEEVSKHFMNIVTHIFFFTSSSTIQFIDLLAGVSQEVSCFVRKYCS